MPSLATAKIAKLLRAAARTETLAAIEIFDRTDKPVTETLREGHYHAYIATATALEVTGAAGVKD